MELLTLELLYNMNKGILFFLGLCIGIMICVSIHYVDKYWLKHVLPLKTEQSVVSRVDTVYMEVAEIPKKQPAEIKPNIAKETETEEQTNDKVSLSDAEFSFENEEQNDVFLDQLMQSKIVKAVLHPLEKKDGKQKGDFFHIFELQQWSTPIKNKITYNRYQTLVKVKGLDITNANVVFWNDNFYLEVKNRYYPIPETDNFVKLTPVTIP